MCKVLVKTAKLRYEEWLSYRKLGIGGSDVGAICGLNPYTTAISVFLDKTSTDNDTYDNEPMRQGRDLEDYVARRFSEVTGLKVRRKNAIYYHEDHPHMLANVDRMIVGDNIGLECKTASILNADKWQDGDIPAHYQLQCHHYMAVTGAKAWYIAVVILGKEFKYIRIDRDEEIINNLITIEENFWKNNVQTGVMPSPDGSRAADAIISQYYCHARHETIFLSGYSDKIERRLELSELIEKLGREKKQLEQEVKLAMADADSAMCGNYEISWKNVITAKLDIDRIKTERPDIYRSYLKETESRRFTVKALQRKEVA